jgi:hypothetical protein
MNWGHYWEHTHHSIFFVFRVDMVGFVDPHKVVAWRSTFSVVASVQNESVFKSVGHGELKLPFSWVERDSYL